MARLAGNSPYYTFALTSKGGKPTEHTIDLPSVTTIIKATLAAPALMYWYYNTGIEGVAKLAQDGTDISNLSPADIKALLKENKLSPDNKRDAAGLRGTGAHEVMEMVCLTGQAPKGPLNKYGEAVLKWSEELPEGTKAVAVEKPVWSFIHGYAGTIDLLYETPDGERVLLDLKTHAPAKKDGPAFDSDRLQLAAYKIAILEMGKGPVDRTEILVAKKDGTYEIDTKELDTSVFLSLLHVYKALGLGASL